jgi:AcrR family transcriptional regulator
MNIREQQDVEMRNRLTAAAQALFRQLGFSAVGIREIAAQAGASTGAVFHKWSNKKAVFEDVMGRPWPNPAAFAVWVQNCKTIEEAREGAGVFLADVAGQSARGKPWTPGAR